MTLKNLSLLAMICILITACGGKKENDDDHSHDSAAKEWKEMDDFHMVMAESFHPYKDSSNLEPAKVNAQDLAKSAKEWRDSSAPEGVDADKMKSSLDELVRLSDEFAAKAGSAADDEIASSLTTLHDLFHDLQNDFYGGAGGHHHDHDHHHDH